MSLQLLNKVVKVSVKACIIPLLNVKFKFSNRRIDNIIRLPVVLCNSSRDSEAIFIPKWLCLIKKVLLHSDMLLIVLMRNEGADPVNYE